MKTFAAIAAIAAPAVLSIGSRRHLARGADIDIDWVIQSYPDRTAAVGDTVTFNWQDEHNVYIHPTGDCDNTDAIEVGEESPAKHTFAEAGTVTFACDISGHCNAGQIVTFEVTEVTSDGGDKSPTEAAANCLSFSGDANWANGTLYSGTFHCDADLRLTTQWFLDEHCSQPADTDVWTSGLTNAVTPVTIPSSKNPWSGTTLTCSPTCVSGVARVTGEDVSCMFGPSEAAGGGEGAAEGGGDGNEAGTEGGGEGASGGDGTTTEGGGDTKATEGSSDGADTPGDGDAAANESGVPAPTGVAAALAVVAAGILVT